MIAWQSYCREARDIELEADVISVHFGERRHKVQVELADDAIELTAVVARRATVDKLEDAALWAWSRNRAGGLVGFRIDQRGRLVGESAVPLDGLTKEEFLLYVRMVASACDQLEFQITGKDWE